MTSLPFVHFIRDHELQVIARHLPGDGRILEIGAGSGWQAAALQERGFDITALDIASSNFADARQFPIIDYDGQRIPFADRSFDAIYSSNVLEHVRDLPAFLRETRRVLKEDGRCVHVLPTHVWRCYSSLAAYPKALLRLGQARDRQGLTAGARRLARAVMQVRHGERGNHLTELWYFRPAWWRRTFAQCGLEVVEDEPVGLFYTAEEMLGTRLSLKKRQGWARRMGSSTHLFVLVDR